MRLENAGFIVLGFYIICQVNTPVRKRSNGRRREKDSAGGVTSKSMKEIFHPRLCRESRPLLFPTPTSFRPLILCHQLYSFPAPSFPFHFTLPSPPLHVFAVHRSEDVRLRSGSLPIYACTFPGQCHFHKLQIRGYPQHDNSDGISGSILSSRSFNSSCWERGE